MPEKVVPGPVQEYSGIREAVCIHTKKIYDSCRDEDIALLILTSQSFAAFFTMTMTSWRVARR